MHQFFPLSWKNKYFEATSHIYFTMCTRSRLKYFLIDLIYSALFFPSLANFLIYFLILVRFKPDLLIKPIVIKKSVVCFINSIEYISVLNLAFNLYSNWVASVIGFSVYCFLFSVCLFSVLPQIFLSYYSIIYGCCHGPQWELH